MLVSFIVAKRLKLDFLHILQTEYLDFCADNLNLSILKYLECRLTIEIDGVIPSFDLIKVEFSPENMLIKGTFNQKFADIKQVKMTNTFLIEEIPGHDNIMKLKLNDRTRSFRLNSKRTSTMAIYN